MEKMVRWKFGSKGTEVEKMVGWTFGTKGTGMEKMVRWPVGSRGAGGAGAARVYCPVSIAEGKKSKLEALGAHLTFAKDCGIAEGQARRDAGDLGMTYVSPYNDVKVLRSNPPCQKPLLPYSTSVPRPGTELSAN